MSSAATRLIASSFVMSFSLTMPTAMTNVAAGLRLPVDRKSTRLNSSHAEIYTLSLHDALPIYVFGGDALDRVFLRDELLFDHAHGHDERRRRAALAGRSEEHTSELQSRRDLHSFPTRRSSDLCLRRRRA